MDPIAIYNYLVNFNPDSSPPITFTPTTGFPTPPPPLGPGDPVTVKSPLALFTFTLDPAPTAVDAAFLSYPMQWFTDVGSTNNPPQDFQVHSYSPTYFAVWDFNSTPTTLHHHFQIYVSYGGTIYPGDPVIINDPPMGPPT